MILRGKFSPRRKALLALVLIVLADQLGRSVGDMYQGAFVPGLVLTAMYATYVFGMTMLRPGCAPALPLEAINAASAREKSIRHGHPSTLHLWWARRPLAAARAVIFAQIDGAGDGTVAVLRIA